LSPKFGHGQAVRGVVAASEFFQGQQKRGRFPMLKFYFNGAPNPAKVALFLEESGLPYEFTFKAEMDEEARNFMFGHLKNKVA
jgi:hypothetical protein